ncbi:hypothetical protein IEQ34_011483 [Dendrobium chrysotoxum]|uniref:Uncharacterized protein n=1 Tax=Dendrobium chrysotoxum TaxID=161865 RepID=A0AAV7GA49_DENCH|nr:hypothetical protein IEQ34_011483 [Dendrobium chrysotoxum]
MIVYYFIDLTHTITGDQVLYNSSGVVALIEAQYWLQLLLSSSIQSCRRQLYTADIGTVVFWPYFGAWRSEVQAQEWGRLVENDLVAMQQRWDASRRKIGEEPSKSGVRGKRPRSLWCQMDIGYSVAPVKVKVIGPLRLTRRVKVIGILYLSERVKVIRLLHLTRRLKVIRLLRLTRGVKVIGLLYLTRRVKGIPTSPLLQDDRRIVQDDVLQKMASENPKNSILPPNIIPDDRRIVLDDVQNLT